MNTEMKHTPTPWKTVSGSECDFIQSSHGLGGYVCRTPDDSQGKRDAEFITLACNSYHPDQAKIKALTEALRDANKHLSDATDYFTARNLGEPARLLMGRLINATARSNAALSLAKS